MIKKVKILAGCLITCCLTLAGLMLMGRLLDPKYTGDSMNSIKAFHSLEKNSVDVIFYGTSHVWKGCDAAAFEEAYNISAYNYGGNWQAFNTTLLFMKDSFRTQKPKAVFVDTYTVNSLISDADMDGQIYYTRAISDFDGKRQFLRECFGNDWKRYVTYYFPITIFHDNWVNIEKENFADASSVADYKNSRGYEKSAEIVPVDLGMCRNGVQYEIDRESIEVLDEMVELCRTNNTSLIFYTCPYVGGFEYADAMKRYAAEKGCDYINLIDCMDEVGFDGAEDFRDNQHLNDSGSKKLALYLGNYLLNNYSIE